MANTKSALKARRVAARRSARNRPIRTALRTYVKNARVTIAAGDVDEATARVRLAAKELDAAATKGVIHKNQAARRKSRLMSQLAATAARIAAQPEAEPEPTTRRRPARAPAKTAPAATTRGRRPAAQKPTEPAEAKPPARTRTRRTTPA